MFPFFPSLGRLVYTSAFLSFQLEFALAYHFYYRFPQSAPRGRFWTALQYLFYLCGSLLCFRDKWLELGTIGDEHSAVRFLVKHAWLVTLNAPEATLPAARQRRS
jgi:hypothetical protein